ncbi:hypothetical protein [Butyrivibrio sp. WCD3002]|uniref:hypothetical protein n=1 Tax=Butyrivibrio sp. WCD3002 TaxID=1280676 RepID=UPI000428122F|nr:hypothetical protein [Butyrivibrio sp. WCD3002]
MARKVYTYTELSNLGKCSFWSEIKSIPQIVASNDMRWALKNDSPKHEDEWDGLFDYALDFHAISMNELQGDIEGNWAEDANKFAIFSLISKMIRNLISDSNDIYEQKWLLGCIKNVGGIFNSISRLEVAGVKPNELYTFGDQNVELLIQIWKKLLDSSIYDENIFGLPQLRERLESIEKPELMQEVLNNAYGFSPQRKISKIVIHGLYYITPFQERFLEAMEKTGIELIFVFPYDSRYPFAYEIWKKTYGEDKKYLPMDKWISAVTNKEDPCGDIFEGRKPKVKREGRVTIREYGSLIDFSNGIAWSADHGEGVYSAGSNEANEIIKAFYPRLYGERKLMAFPIGKFIWNINDMWDENENAICLSEYSLLECFSSGWLTHGEYSGKDYVNDLTKIMPFFRDCNKISDWEKRLEELEDIEKNCLWKTAKGSDKDAYRWQQMMGNPLADFSQFSVPVERVKGIIVLIKHLLFIARELFVDNREINISEHIRRLNKILDGCVVTDEVSELEREIARKILYKLNTDNNTRIKCFPADAARALELYLEGTFDDGEIKGRNWAVMPMYHVDAAHITKKKNGIHICLCDNDSMPGGKGAYPWPLNENILKSSYEKKKNELLKCWLYTAESTSIANRYFMYSALKHRNVSISWVSEIRGKKRAESPYIGLIRSAIDVKYFGPRKKGVKWEQVDHADRVDAKITEHCSDDLAKEIPKEAKMDYGVCPLRYLYGYIVDDAPSFQDEFMQSFSITSLIVAISNAMKDKGVKVEEVYQNVMDLFPAIKKSAKRQIYDYLTGDRKDYTEEDEAIVGRDLCGGLYYTEQRLRAHFPDYSGRKEALKAYAKLDSEEGKKSMKFTKPGFAYTPEGKIRKSHPCAFCPNVDNCKYSVFPRDREKVYG